MPKRPGTTVKVDYMERDGWHVFTSEEITGLYVAHTDLETAFNDIAPSIEQLLKLNERVSCKATPKLPFAEFLEAIRAESDIPPAYMIDSPEFVLTR